MISTPSKDFRPFYGERVTLIEDGGHLRKGYSFLELENKLDKAGLKIVMKDSVGGYFTQECVALSRLLSDKLTKNVLVNLLIHLLLKPFTLLDPLVSYPNYTIFVIACRKQKD